MDEARLVDLETRVAYQEDMIESLNRLVYRQQQQLDQLQAVCAALRGSLASLAQSGREPDAPAEERPPHY